MRAVILAGGFGARLRSRVADLPKPMAPIADRPFLEYILDRLVSAGILEITISVGYRAEAIIDHFGDGYRGAALSYAVETEPLGTGGAILFATGRECSEPVLVLNGDTFLDLDFRAFVDWYETSPSEVAMVLTNVADAGRYGSVVVDGERVVGFREKGVPGSGLINAGVYVLHPSSFLALGLSGRFSLESDFLQRHTAVLAPRAFVTKGYFVDIGIPEDYDRAQDDFPVLCCNGVDQ